MRVCECFHQTAGINHRWTREQRAALLQFCTGSARVPAQGFKSLMGYNGQQQRFTLRRAAHSSADHLPTASACFNTLKLPDYPTPAVLRAKLHRMLTEARGFDEGAAA